ncbi:MAG: Panacea domain-containing protein [Bacteroidia bacterium]
MEKLIKAEDISNYILTLTDADSGDAISHLKLQKLLYYVQGFYLAMNRRPLFHEKIMAWNHGPVIAEIYNKYKGSGNNPLFVDTNFDETKIDEILKEFIHEIYQVFGQFSAWRLREMTHSEPTWKNTPQSQEITHESMIDYFSTQLK